jgi:hypothetical protein
MRNVVERATAITVVATAFVASGAGHVRAGLVTYTETATVSGSLGSTTFTDATITTTQTADPANGVVIAPLTHSLNVLDITATLMVNTLHTIRYSFEDQLARCEDGVGESRSEQERMHNECTYPPPVRGLYSRLDE